MDDLVRALALVLAIERSLIRSGDLAGLDAALPAKAEAARALEARAGTPWDAAAVRALGESIARNQRLLRAAAEGLRDAARRREAMGEACRRLSSYDRRGERPAAAPPSPRVERRA